MKAHEAYTGQKLWDADGRAYRVLQTRRMIGLGQIEVVRIDNGASNATMFVRADRMLRNPPAPRDVVRTWPAAKPVISRRICKKLAARRRAQ